MNVKFRQMILHLMASGFHHCYSHTGGVRHTQYAITVVSFIHESFCCFSRVHENVDMPEERSVFYVLEVVPYSHSEHKIRERPQGKMCKMLYVRVLSHLLYELCIEKNKILWINSIYAVQLKSMLIFEAHTLHSKTCCKY